jgi:hypothetical protein
MIPSARGHWFQTSPHVPEALTPLIVDQVKRGLIISAHLVVDLAAHRYNAGERSTARTMGICSLPS